MSVPTRKDAEEGVYAYWPRFLPLYDEIDRLREALAIAADLLAQEGYSRDPDYRQEWRTIQKSLSPPTGDGDA